MNKISIIAIVIAAVIVAGIGIGVAFQTQQLKASTTIPSGSTTSSPPSPVTSSGSTGENSQNGKILPVSLGAPVTVDTGNITATAIDPNTGRIYIVYYKTENNITNLYLTRSDDNGKTFSSPVQVNDIKGDVSADDSSPPVIKVASTGDVYVSWLYSDFSEKWKQQFEWGYGTIRIARSSDGGQTFGKAAQVGTELYGTWAQYDQDIGISPDGKTVYVAWISSSGAGEKPINGKYWTDLIMIAKSTDGAQTFGKAVPVDGENPACSCCKVNVAVDNNDGSIYVSWRKLYQAPQSEHTPPTDLDYAYRQIVVAKSTDGAQTFSKPVNVYDDKFLYNSCVMSGSQMAVDSKHNLHIVWYTGSNATGHQPGAYYAVSSDGGKSFGTPVPLVAADHVSPGIEYMAMDSKDNAWMVWEDRSGQNNTMWMVNELPPTMIDVAKITPDGHMTKSVLDIGQGRLPGIIVSNDIARIVWNTADHTIKFASLSKT